MKIKDAFVTLGISEDSSEADVKQVYRNLVKKFHPDVNSDSTARRNFEVIQQAYELIEAYFVFKNSPEYTKNSEHQYRKTRVRNVVKQRAAQREFYFAKLLFDIATFRTSKKFYTSSVFAILSAIVAIFIVFDFYTTPKVSYEPIEGITVPLAESELQNALRDNVYLYVQNRKVSISPINVDDLSTTQYVKISQSKWMHQLLDISYIKNGKTNFVYFYNFYNDAFFVFVLLLLFGLLAFFYTKRNMFYFFIIKYYNFYFLPLVIIYVLLGEARIFRLLAII